MVAPMLSESHATQDFQYRFRAILHCTSTHLRSSRVFHILELSESGAATEVTSFASCAREGEGSA